MREAYIHREPVKSFEYNYGNLNWKKGRQKVIVQKLSEWKSYEMFQLKKNRVSSRFWNEAQQTKIISFLPDN